MVTSQTQVCGLGIAPVDTTGATTNGTAFDLAAQGSISYATCIVLTGNVAANMTTLKIQESDDNSNWSDVSGASFTAPTAASGDNKIYKADIACNGTGRLRYLRVTATGGAGATLIAAVWLGTRSAETPSSATEAGLAEWKIV